MQKILISILVTMALGLAAGAATSTFGGSEAANAGITVIVPPSDYVTDVQRVDASSPSNSIEAKDVNAQCPSPKKVIGGAADIEGGTSGIPLRSDQPTVASGLGDTWIGTGEEAVATNLSWSVRASAFCAITTSPQPNETTAATYVSDPEIVTQVSPDDSANSKVIIATCPTGKAVISGGGDVDNGNGGVSLRTSLEISRTQWEVVATETSPTNVAWNVEVRAVCARLNSPSADSGTGTYVRAPEIVSLTSPLDSVDKTVVVPCPSGKSVIGGGADIDGDTHHVSLRSSQVNSTTGMASSFYAVGQETSPTSDNWSVKARAVCAIVNAPGPVITPPAS